MNVAGMASAAFALLVWGVTFANARALLMDFSALEIMVVRFALTWAVLRGMERAAGRSAPTGGTRLARGASPAGGRSDAVETTASTRAICGVALVSFNKDNGKVYVYHT